MAETERPKIEWRNKLSPKMRARLIQLSEVYPIYTLARYDLKTDRALYRLGLVDMHYELTTAGFVVIRLLKEIPTPGA